MDKKNDKDSKNIGDVKITLPPLKDDDDVKFTLPLSKELNKKVVAEAKKYGLTKNAYIRFILEQVVERSEKE